MRWTVERDARGFLVVTTFEQFDLATHGEMIRDVVGREDWWRGIDVLFDHRALDRGDTGLDAMCAALRNHERYDDRIGEGRADAERWLDGEEPAT